MTFYTSVGFDWDATTHRHLSGDRQHAPKGKSNPTKRVCKGVSGSCSGGFLAHHQPPLALRVLAQLRNLGQTLRDLSMDSIAKFVSIEKDAAYMVAQEKEQVKFVTNLLSKTNFGLEQVADIAGVSLEFVQNVQQKLSTKK